MLTFKCPVCGASNLFEDEDRGGQIFCRVHGGAIDVPEAGDPSAKVEPQSGSTQHRAERDVPAMKPAGTALWSLGVSVSQKPLPVRSAPITDSQGRLVAAVQDVVLCVALEAAGPRVLWEYATGEFIPGSPACAPDGSLRVHAGEGRLHALSIHGEPLWPPLDVGEPLNWASPLVDADGTTWLCGYGGGVIKVSASGQKTPRPYFRSPNRFDCTGVLRGGTLVVGGEDQFVHAIDLRGDRGAELWSHSENRGKTAWFINSAIALSGETYVVASRDQHLYGFDAQGNEQWKAELPGQVLGAPVVDESERVYVGLTIAEQGATPVGAIACYDIRRRQWIWQAPAQGPVESTPVVGSDGLVYFGDNAGWVHAVTTAGAAAWQTFAGSPVRSPGKIVAPGIVTFGTDEGRLIALQCSSPAQAGGWPCFGGPATWAVSGEIRAGSITRATVSASGPSSAPPAERPKAKPPAPPPKSVEPAKPLVPEPVRVPVPPPVVERPVEPPRPLPPPVTSPPVVVEPEPVRAAPAQPGRLTAIIDFLTGEDLLALRGRPWSVPRGAVQRPVFLTNGGAGELIVQVECRGRGLSPSPARALRIPPGRKKFVVLNFDAVEDWSLVSFTGQQLPQGRRVVVRAQRVPST